LPTPAAGSQVCETTRSRSGPAAWSSSSKLSGSDAIALSAAFRSMYEAFTRGGTRDRPDIA
jgi:hypothetical protein